MPNLDHPLTAIIVFAKEPKIGKVKTRLQVDLSENTTLRLYKAFVRDVLRTVQTIRHADKYLYYAGAGSSIPFLKGLSKNFKLKRQMGADLGERMCRAALFCKRKGYEKIIIIGTDCVALTGNNIKKAELALNRHDFVVGPTNDGGYYLIGLKLPSQSIFANIHWSTDRVLKQTLDNIKKNGSSVRLLGYKDDIDTIEDLNRLKKDKNTLTKLYFTKRALKNL